MNSVNASAEQKYASISAMYDDENCKVFTWLGKDENKKKVQYQNKATKSQGVYSCEVSIPVKEFERLFDVCFLTSLSNARDGFGFRKPFGAGFYGGEADGRDDIYWFGWWDAEYTFADFRCLLNETEQEGRHIE